MTERLAAPVTEIPNARSFEQVDCTISLMTLQPIHHLSRDPGELVAAGRARKRVDVIADFRSRGKYDAIDVDEIGDPIQVRLRLRAQFVVHRYQHVLASEQIEPLLEMRRVTIPAAEIGTRLQHLVERAARPGEMNYQLVG